MVGREWLHVAASVCVGLTEFFIGTPDMGRRRSRKKQKAQAARQQVVPANLTYRAQLTVQTPVGIITSQHIMYREPNDDAAFARIVKDGLNSNGKTLNWVLYREVKGGKVRVASMNNSGHGPKVIRESIKSTNKQVLQVVNGGKHKKQKVRYNKNHDPDTATIEPAKQVADDPEAWYMKNEDVKVLEPPKRVSCKGSSFMLKHLKEVEDVKSSGKN